MGVGVGGREPFLCITVKRAQVYDKMNDIQEVIVRHRFPLSTFFLGGEGCPLDLHSENYFLLRVVQVYTL